MEDLGPQQGQQGCRRRLIGADRDDQTQTGGVALAAHQVLFQAL
ncbi:hypothetical protein [uncultured Lamprocystis sp.]|nr:hypothetical protein [uncultured Lamprocystis sp.]